MQISVGPLTQWFSNECKPLFEQVGFNPRRIFNVDESGFGNQTGVYKVIGQGDTVEMGSDDSKTQLTTIWFCSGTGDLYPPTVLYRGRGVYQRWTENGIPGATYWANSSGWVDEDTFLLWLRKIFVPATRELRESGKVVLVLDNLRSHVTARVRAPAERRSILLLPLYPNSAQYLQCLDLSVFGLLKQRWWRVLREYRLDGNRGEIAKSDIPRLLYKILDGQQEAITNCVKRGWRESGMIPFYPARLLRKLDPHHGDDDHTERQLLSANGAVSRAKKRLAEREEERRRGRRERGSLVSGGVEDLLEALSDSSQSYLEPVQHSDDPLVVAASGIDVEADMNKLVIGQKILVEFGLCPMKRNKKRLVDYGHAVGEIVTLGDDDIVSIKWLTAELASVETEIVGKTDTMSLTHQFQSWKPVRTKSDLVKGGFKA